MAPVLGLSGQHIGDTGAQALAVPLEPRQKSDGHWVYNGAMEDLDLSGGGVILRSLKGTGHASQ